MIQNSVILKVCGEVDAFIMILRMLLKQTSLVCFHVQHILEDPLMRNSAILIFANKQDMVWLCPLSEIMNLYDQSALASFPFVEHSDPSHMYTVRFDFLFKQ